MSDRTAARVIGGLLAFMLLLALGAVRSSWTEGKAVGVQSEKQTAKRVDEKKTEDHLAPQVGEQAPASDRQAAEKKAETNEDASEFWPMILGKRFKITDTLLVLFTGVLAWKTWGLDAATKKLWEAGERQISQAVISADAAKRSADYARDSLIQGQRAWVTVEAQIGEGGMTFEFFGVQVPVVLKLKNIGNAIALNVTPRAQIFFDEKHGPRVESWRRFIADSVSQGASFSIFFIPNKTAENSSEPDSPVVYVSTSPFNETKIIDMQKDLVVYIGGCATYTFPSDPGVTHHTGFFFHVRKNDGTPISPKDGALLADDLILTRDKGTNFFSID